MCACISPTPSVCKTKRYSVCSCARVLLHHMSVTHVRPFPWKQAHQSPDNKFAKDMLDNSLTDRQEKLGELSTKRSKQGLVTNGGCAACHLAPTGKETRHIFFVENIPLGRFKNAQTDSKDFRTHCHTGKHSNHVEGQ